MNDSTPKTTKKKITTKTAKKASKAAKVVASKKAPAAKPAKATKPAKVTAAQLKAARKLLASQNPLIEARLLLKAAKQTEIVIAGKAPSGLPWSDCDPISPPVLKATKKAISDAAGRHSAMVLAAQQGSPPPSL